MTIFDDYDTAVRQRAELRRDNWMIPLRNAREQLVASVKLIPLSEPRFAITGEDISPRDGWFVYGLWGMNRDAGYEYMSVWARDADEAIAYAGRFYKFVQQDEEG